MIDITGIDLVKFAKKVYELSSPQGMGYFHFQPGGLSDEEAQEIVNRSKDDKNISLEMDYVKGRACKMNVIRKEGKLFINNTWYDHTTEQFRTLLFCFGINSGFPSNEHPPACNCLDCKFKRICYSGGN